jgi:hypothetical protein
MANLSTILKRDTAGRVATDGIADDAVTIAKVSPALISGATALTTLADGDCILVLDTSATDNRKVTLNDLSNFMKTKSTALLAVVKFNCGVSLGNNSPTNMVVSSNPHELSVSVNANRIQLGAGIWQIEASFSGYYNSWNGYLGTNESEQMGGVTLQIDGGAATTNLGSALTFKGGSVGFVGGRDVDLVVQVKVGSIGYVTPLRIMDNITGGIGVFNSGRSVARVYKLG